MMLADAGGVTKKFGDFTAVDGVNLTVARGEVVGLLGANGAGKTTLMKMLLGLISPTAGRVVLFGETITPDARKRIGYVPQGLGLYEDLTVAENLQFVARAFGVDTPRLGDLEARKDVLVRELSLGLRRRTAFLGALSHRPELLILDEPTSGVDVIARSALWDTIRAAADSGAGVLVSTHHMEEVDQCDRVVVMAGGRVVLSGTMDEIVGNFVSGTERTERFERRFAELAVA
jgi:ABC-2 type transport system ATP-binding protein/ribosome-dependent ATPase